VWPVCGMVKRLCRCTTSLRASRQSLSNLVVKPTTPKTETGGCKVRNDEICYVPDEKALPPMGGVDCCNGWETCCNVCLSRSGFVLLWCCIGPGPLRARPLHGGYLTTVWPQIVGSMFCGFAVKFGPRTPPDSRSPGLCDST
jgi:hypothetical protein